MLLSLAFSASHLLLLSTQLDTLRRVRNILPFLLLHSHDPIKSKCFIILRGTMKKVSAYVLRARHPRGVFNLFTGCAEGLARLSPRDPRNFHPLYATREGNRFGSKKSCEFCAFCTHNAVCVLITKYKFLQVFSL